VRTLVQAALIAIVASTLSVSAAVAQSTNRDDTDHPDTSRAGAPAALQADPRDPFDPPDPPGPADPGDRAGNGGSGGGASAAPSGVAAGTTLPHTGGASSARLVGVAVALMTIGAMVLWAARHRPRHGIDRRRRGSHGPRHARRPAYLPGTDPQGEEG
jgi:hypothetical protein